MEAWFASGETEVLRSRAILTVAGLLFGIAVRAAPVLELGTPHTTFSPGPVTSFDGQDYNADGTADDTQDMTFRFSMTTPSVFSAPGFVIVESGRYNVGFSLLLVGDRLYFQAGGRRQSSNGLNVLNVVSRPLQPATTYAVIVSLQTDMDGNGTADDTRGATYTNGVYAVDPAYPGAQVHTDIRDGGVPDWSGTGPGGYGVSSNEALYVVEGSSPDDFPGAFFTTSDGTLDSDLEFFANTFLDRVPTPEGLNVLLITADDMNWDTVGAFGAPLPGVTPHMDALAAEGMRFERAHVVLAVCQPSRQSLMTGQFPHRNGGEGFEPINTTATTLVEVLANRGYRAGVMSKAGHLAPNSEFQWHMRLNEADLAQGRDPELFYAGAKAFMQQAVAAGRPFFLMANSNDPHRPYHGSQQEISKYGDTRFTFATPSRVYAAHEVPIPGFLADLASIRIEIAQYYSSCRRCDDTVGRVLDALDELGLRDSTVVIFLSDNGIAVPFAKTNCWYNSGRTPLIIRWPGVIAPGSANGHHFVNTIDIMPTLLEALGIQHDLPFDGVSFLPLLRGKRSPTARNRIQTVFHETSSKRRYEMRAVQGRRYGYIFNAWSDGTNVFKNESQNGLTWNAMVAAGTNAAVQARVDHFKYRVPEELYDYVQDPDALSNLVSRVELEDRLWLLRRELLDWMTAKADPQLAAFRAYVDANPLGFDPAAAPVRRLAISAAAGGNTVDLQYGPSRANMRVQLMSASGLSDWDPSGPARAGTGTMITWSNRPAERAHGYFTVDSYLELK